MAAKPNNGQSASGRLGDQPLHRVGDYATTSHPVFALVDSHSFYVLGYFEERPNCGHIRIGDPAQIILYSNQQTLHGHVASIGRAIVDQSVEQGTGLVANIKPNIPLGTPRAARSGADCL